LQQRPIEFCKLACKILQNFPRKNVGTKNQCNAQCACLLPSYGCYSLHLPQRDGQAELILLNGYIPRWFTHLQTVSYASCARHHLNSLTVHTTKLSHWKRWDISDLACTDRSQVRNVSHRPTSSDTLYI